MANVDVNVEFPTDQTLEFLRATPTPYISDALTQHDIQNVRMWGVLPFGEFDDPYDHVAGPAVTMRFIPTYNRERVYESEYRHTELVEEAPAGSIVVIEGEGTVCVGERSCSTAVRSELEAVVSDGPVRDVHGVRERSEDELGVFVPGGGGQEGIKMETYVSWPAECVGYNLPIYCGIPDKRGAYVRPGDVVVGDNNGVVVIPRASLEQIVETTKEIAGLEEDMQGMVDEGETWKDIYASVHSDKYI